MHRSSVFSYAKQVWLDITMILLGIPFYPLNIPVTWIYQTYITCSNNLKTLFTASLFHWAPCTSDNLYISMTPPIYNMIYDIQCIHDIWYTMYKWYTTYISTLPAYQTSVYLSLAPPDGFLHVATSLTDTLLCGTRWYFIFYIFFHQLCDTTSSGTDSYS